MTLNPQSVSVTNAIYNSVLNHLQTQDMFAKKVLGDNNRINGLIISSTNHANLRIIMRMIAIENPFSNMWEPSDEQIYSVLINVEGEKDLTRETRITINLNDKEGFSAILSTLESYIRKSYNNLFLQKERILTIDALNSSLDLIDIVDREFNYGHTRDINTIIGHIEKSTNNNLVYENAGLELKFSPLRDDKNFSLFHHGFQIVQSFYTVPRGEKDNSTLFFEKFSMALEILKEYFEQIKNINKTGNDIFLVTRNDSIGKISLLNGVEVFSNTPQKEKLIETNYRLLAVVPEKADTVERTFKMMDIGKIQKITLPEHFKGNENGIS